VVGPVRDRLEQSIHEVGDENGWQSMQLAIQPDHVQLCMRSTPSTLPSDMPRLLTGRSAHDLREEFPPLCTLPSLGTRSLFLSTAGTVSQEIIQRYSERQAKT